ncbi:MAG: T9SS type A sorting domain-containing protein [Janthinobacterium lividum]
MLSKIIVSPLACSRQLAWPTLLFLLVLASPLLGWGQSTSLVTLTATYNQLPANTAIVFEEMKFGKTAGFIFTKDDGVPTDVTVVMPVLNGGTAANGVTYPGAYYTDGAGLPVKFKYNFALNTSTITGSWQQYVAALAKGDNITNHSHLHTKAYNAWRAIKDTEKAAYDKLGIRTRTLVIPADYAGYVANSIHLGYKFIGSAFAATTTDGYDAEIQWGDALNVANINPSRILASRANFDGKWLESGQPTIKAFIDKFLAESTNGVKVFGHAFSHGPGETEIDGFKSFVDYLLNHPDNNDRVWIAGQQELAEYYEVRNYFLTHPGSLTKTITGNSVVYTFDVAGLPAEGLLRDFCLRLPTANLTGVAVSGADTTSYNLTSGLVNVYLKNKQVKSPYTDIVPPQILTAQVSPVNTKAIDLVYNKNVRQTAAGFSVAANTITSLTGSGKNWQLRLLNDWQPTQSVTYQLQTGDAVEVEDTTNQVCSHMEFLVSREVVDTISTDNSRPLNFRNYLWQNVDGTYTNMGSGDFQQTVATESVQAGQEVRISWKAEVTNGVVLAISTTDAYNEALGVAGINAGLMIASGNLRLINDGNDTYAGEANAAYYGLLRKANGAIIAQKSSDGITWVDATPLSLVTTDKLYIVAALRGGSTPPVLTQPKIELLGAITPLNGAPLPVTLTSFTAARVAEGVRLSWNTAMEKDLAYFETQRSTDGRTFSTVARVAGQGQSTHPSHYTSLDPQLVPGLSYYRLRQVDYDGTSTFSPVVAVTSSQELVLFPNPTRTYLNLVALGTDVHYRVLNMLGSVVLKGTVPTGAAVINVASLPASLYQLEVTYTEGQVTRKFVKEN